jgi:two-component system LytT family sensor kinase
MPGAKNFMFLLVSIFVYNGTYFMELGSTNLDRALFWYQIEHVAVPLLPYIWLLICLEFTLTISKIRKHLVTLAALYPLSVYIIFYTNPLHHLFDQSYQFVNNGSFYVLVSEKGSLYYMIEVVVSLMLIATLGIYIKSRQDAPKVYRSSYNIIILASIIPWTGGIMNQTPWNGLGLDYFPISLSISGIMFLFGIFRFRVMSAIPVVHKMVYDQTKEGILLIDPNDYILDCNQTFHQIFPDFSLSKMYETLADFYKNYKEVYEALQNNSISHFCHKQGEKEFYYRPEFIDISVENNIVIGRMLRIEDITGFIEHQAILESEIEQAVEKAEVNEIAFLQAQINPHFLNNTLTLISAMVTREPQKAKNMIVDLSEYLMNCYQFDADDPLTQLRDELQFVKTYVTIEKVRFMERLEVQFLDENVPDVKIPRLVIQPLVENAIRHGVLKRASGGIVTVAVVPSEYEVCIRIEDDGVGIPEEKIAQLLTGNAEGQGVGIVNIQRRLLKYYGKGLQVESSPGNGTCVSFCIPINLTDERGEVDDTSDSD